MQRERITPQGGLPCPWSQLGPEIAEWVQLHTLLWPASVAVGFLPPLSTTLGIADINPLLDSLEGGLH